MKIEERIRPTDKLCYCDLMATKIDSRDYIFTMAFVVVLPQFHVEVLFVVEA